MAASEQAGPDRSPWRPTRRRPSPRGASPGAPRAGLSIALLLVLWEVVARSGIMPGFMLPPLTVMFDQHPAGRRDRASCSSISASRSTGRFVGFFDRRGAGIASASLIARSRRRRAGSSIRWSSVGFPMPKIAFMPIFMLWFGFYDISKISIVVFDAIFPIITATVIGPARRRARAAVVGAQSRRQRARVLWEIVLPAAAAADPDRPAGRAAHRADRRASSTEMIMGGTGIGGAMLHASRFVDSPGVFAAMVEIASWVLCHQGHGADPPPAPALASGDRARSGI